MSETRNYLIDSNVVIYYLNKQLPAAGMNYLEMVMGAEPWISVVTKIEVLGYEMDSKSYNEIVTFLNAVGIIGLQNNIANRTILIRRRHKLKLGDAIIAATALVYDFELITRNTADFKKVPGLKLVNPHEL